MKLTNFSSFGSVISAILASICCIGPVVLALFGVGGASLLLKFTNLRPYFIAITVVLLGSAFYLTYRKRRVESEDGTCEFRSAGKWNKIALWSATILVGFFLAFPYLISSSNSSSANLSNSPSVTEQMKVKTAEVTIPVKGMTCSGCEFGVESAVRKLDGILQVKADYQKGEAYVKFEKGKVNPDEVIEAINRTGYKAINLQNM